MIIASIAYQARQCHEMIERMAIEPELVQKRRCADCGQTISLATGRQGGKSWWVHDMVAECQNDRIGHRVMFDSREAAMAADEIFL